MASFEIGPQDFLLDGRPLQIISGALHYFRVHPDQWAERIRSARLMGLNTIETYVPWNLHAPQRGTWDTGGRLDVARFLDEVAAQGMHAIVRPGPYICAEWDGGGLPAWLFADGGVGVRRDEPQFLAAIGEYFAALLPVVAERQVTRGGPVLAVQVENEYGAYPGVPADERVRYLRALVGLIRGEGIEVPLVTCDQADDEMLERGGLPELHRTATFGSRSAERLAVLRRHQPTGPLMCMEFWDGWFDSWGLEHHTTPVEQTAQDLDTLLGTGASVNIYMVHGGTNFGLTSGANDKGLYRPTTTSYDYDAPIAEHGAPTAKYSTMREVIARHSAVPDELPPPAPRAPELEVVLGERLALTEALALLADPELGGGPHEHPPTMDAIGQWSGFCAYSTTIRPDDAVLTVDEVRDRAVVLVDGEPVGVLDRAQHTWTVALPARSGELTVLVEDCGRVNYGARIGEPKGLIGTARTATRELTGWTATPLRMLDAPDLVDVMQPGPPGSADAPVGGPVLLRGTFDSVAGADHFLELDGWTRGLAWVNGWPLGRYWSLGPTRTMYVPGPVVRESGNTLLVLELHGARRPQARFVAGPDLGITEV